MRASVSPNTTGSAALLEFEVAVRKLSNSAITLDIDSKTDSTLKDYPEISVSLQLPKRAKPYTFACLVRNRTEHDGTVIYTCEFDWGATIDPLGAVEDLLEYTLEG